MVAALQTGSRESSRESRGRWNYSIIGSLSNDDGDVNEDGKEAIGLAW